MNSKLKALLTVFMAMLALATIFTGCATSREKQTTALLKQAGFTVMPASTFEKQQKLKSLKADQISMVKGASGKVYYVYPLHEQNLLYVGRSAEYTAYENLVRTLRTETVNLKAEESKRANDSWAESVESSSGTDGSWEDVWSAPSE